MLSRYSSSPRNRSRFAVRPVAHRCASSCVYGPQTTALSIPAEGIAWDMKRSVRHGLSPPMTPVRLPPAIRHPKTTDGEIITDHRDIKVLPNSPNDAHTALPPHGLRRTIH